MKRFVLSILVLSVLALAGCSRSEDKTTVKPQSTPDAERLKSDSERLQQATANAAREREKAAQSAASPTPTLAPQP
jgi:outer membrane murein-binding lipoprotein Lpp